MNKIFIYHLYYFPAIGDLIRQTSNSINPNEWAWDIFPRILKEWYGRDIKIEWNDSCPQEGFFFLTDTEFVHWELKMKRVIPDWTHAKQMLGASGFEPINPFQGRDA